MRILTLHVALLCLPLLSSAPAAQPPAGSPSGSPPRSDDDGAALEEAERLVQAGDQAGAVEVLTEHLKRTADDAPALALMGRCLIAVERLDEAAHYLDRARERYQLLGDRRRAKRLETSLRKADVLSRRRAALFKTLTRDLQRAAEKLYENGQTERALELFRRLVPSATPEQRRDLETWIGRIAAAEAQVDLDAAAAEEPGEEGHWPLIELESEHYRLACHLEPDVVDLVADTMDDIYAAYVRIYFDGDERKAPSAKATIHIHATWDDMAALYGPTPSGGLGGWWSPGGNEVHTYDTRDRGSSLDEMLDTLFHEASHQFMTALARGGPVPAWLNEGTSCFFEGSVAMSDHRVLWPDAALGRLGALSAALRSDAGPGLAAVIGYDQPGSYGGEYYAWGWGIVYFLQQWEDPETFEYAFRPLYSRYRSAIVSGSESSRELFEQVFLGGDSPLGHTSLEDFERDWSAWILDTVRPDHYAPKPERRARRLAAAERYLAQADVAAEQGRRAPISEEEFLLRALSPVEYVRTRIDDEAAPSKDLLVLQARILERLERNKAAAALLERLLDLHDQQRIELTSEEYEDYERRLLKLDRGNWALRNLRSRTRTHTTKAKALLADYLEQGDDKLLRAYTFAAAAAAALGDEEELAAEAKRLRQAAREAGRLLGRVAPLRGAASAWFTPFTFEPYLRVEQDGVTMRSVRPLAMIDTSLPLAGEYELRARLERATERHMGTAHGLVVSGTPQGDWTIVGINDEGHLGTWTLLQQAGAARLRSVRVHYLDRPVPAEESPLLAVHVWPDGRVLVSVDEREPIELAVGLGGREGRELASPAYAGVFVRDGEVTARRLVVEIYP